MKNPYELIRLKEEEITKLKKEIEALRLVAPLLGDQGPAGNGKVDLRRVVDMP
jgi:hypothetical protein